MSRQAIQDQDSAAGESRKLERAATWLSLACAAHCLLVPIGAALLPLLGSSASSFKLGQGAELVLMLLVVTSVSAGAAWGFRRHRDLRVAATMIGSLSVYVLGHLLEGSSVGPSVSILGALLLAASSFVSARLSQTCDDPTHAH